MPVIPHSPLGTCAHRFGQAVLSVHRMVCTFDDLMNLKCEMSCILILQCVGRSLRFAESCYAVQHNLSGVYY